MLCCRKDLLQDAVNLTNCCREEYLTSSQAVQASVDEVKKDKEYASFITRHKYIKTLIFFNIKKYLLTLINIHVEHGHAHAALERENVTLPFLLLSTFNTLCTLWCILSLFSPLETMINYSYNSLMFSIRNTQFGCTCWLFTYFKQFVENLGWQLNYY